MTIGKSEQLTDTFCRRLAADLGELDLSLRQSLTGEERSNVLKLVAGLTVVMQISTGNVPPTAELNAVLRGCLGNGFSWFTCIQYLSGARARETLAQHRAHLRETVNPAVLAFADRALPQMGRTLQTMMTESQIKR
ncbi:hypothetical protein [Ralstonia pickettii]|uniref:hypothetical protein n=1 Tax=Ralstonia pickettii TaxID=329 RepID=UPI0015BB5E0D|nr:hypothetical protein [Ralstonia pickettii]NWK43341.1 hypothetical protein [Ralstonia pickettii]